MSNQNNHFGSLPKKTQEDFINVAMRFEKIAGKSASNVKNLK
jgi:hypothetical protein